MSTTVANVWKEEDKCDEDEFRGLISNMLHNIDTERLAKISAIDNELSQIEKDKQILIKELMITHKDVFAPCLKLKNKVILNH